MVLIVLSCIGLGILAFLPLWALAGWKKSADSGGLVPSNKLTIVVPFRNEANRILPLLQSLKKLQHAAGPVEIVLVDDHSTDEGAQLVAGFISTMKRVKLMQAPGKSNGKKAALTYGIAISTGSIIVTTDADCRFSENWLTSLRKLFTDPDIVMTCGLVAPVTQSGMLGKFVAFEMAALTGISAGSLGQGYPTMCNGANLAFRKQAFDEVGGYTGNEHIPSGDDEFLLEKMSRQFPEGVRYITDPASVVRTENVSGFAEFAGQRIRWASKWRQGINRMNAWLGPILFLCYAAMIAGWVNVAITGQYFFPMAIFTVMKLIADGLLIRRVMKKWGSKPHILGFFFAETVYPFYTILFALLSFKRQYVWKGRRYEEALT